MQTDEPPPDEPQTDDTEPTAPPAGTSGEGGSATGGTDLATGLERLAKLHDDGELNDDDYDAAKLALIAAAASGG